MRQSLYAHLGELYMEHRKVCPVCVCIQLLSPRLSDYPCQKFGGHPSDGRRVGTISYDLDLPSESAVGLVEPPAFFPISRPDYLAVLGGDARHGGSQGYSLPSNGRLVTLGRYARRSLKRAVRVCPYIVKGVLAGLKVVDLREGATKRRWKVYTGNPSDTKAFRKWVATFDDEKDSFVGQGERWVPPAFQPWLDPRGSHLDHYIGVYTKVRALTGRAAAEKVLLSGLMSRYWLTPDRVSKVRAYIRKGGPEDAFKGFNGVLVVGGQINKFAVDYVQQKCSKPLWELLKPTILTNRPAPPPPVIAPTLPLRPDMRWIRLADLNDREYRVLRELAYTQNVWSSCVPNLNASQHTLGRSAREPEIGIIKVGTPASYNYDVEEFERNNPRTSSCSESECDFDF